MKYKLTSAVSGEIPVLGHRYAFDFAATRTTPQSDQDEAVFEYLVTISMAERVPESEGKAKIAAEEPPALPTELVGADVPDRIEKD